MNDFPKIKTVFFFVRVRLDCVLRNGENAQVTTVFKLYFATFRIPINISSYWALNRKIVAVYRLENANTKSACPEKI